MEASRPERITSPGSSASTPTAWLPILHCPVARQETPDASRVSQTVRSLTLNGATPSGIDQRQPISNVGRTRQRDRSAPKARESIVKSENWAGRAPSKLSSRGRTESAELSADLITNAPPSSGGPETWNG